MNPLDLAKLAGAKSDEEADHLLWSGTAFPFVGVRVLWYQLRHALRHRICVDNPEARCFGRRALP